MNSEQEHEERLERLLGALGSAPTDAEFAARMLRRLHQRSAAVRRPRPAVWAWGLGSAVTCGLVCIVMLHLPARTGDIDAGKAKQNEVAGVSERVPEPPEPSASLRDGGMTNFVVRRHEAPGEGRGRILRVADVRSDTVHKDEADKGAAALASFPAPPLPLTEQERLLLKVLHRGDPEEIAMLDPVVRAGEHAADAAEFQEFFKPAPLPLEIEAELAITKEKGESR